MSKNNNTAGKATTNAMVRMQQRIAKVQEVRMQHQAARVAARAAAAEKAAKHAQYVEELKAIAEKHGMPLPTVKSAAVRTSTAATATAPKTGVTARVWQIAKECNFDRKAARELAKAESINEATFATQYALAKRASLAAC